MITLSAAEATVLKDDTVRRYGQIRLTAYGTFKKSIEFSTSQRPNIEPGPYALDTHCRTAIELEEIKNKK